MIFKTASAETERATKELVDRLAEVAEVGGGGAGSGKEAAASDKAPSAEAVIKAKQVERIKHLQVRPLACCLWLWVRAVLAAGFVRMRLIQRGTQRLAMKNMHAL